jgi:hypothetical protein
LRRVERDAAASDSQPFDHPAVGEHHDLLAVEMVEAAEHVVGRAE